FATQNKEGTLKEAFDEWMGKAEGKAVIDYGFHMAVVEANNRTLKEIEELPEWGITSIKVYMAYKNILQLEDDEIYKVMEVCGRKGILVGVHAEIGDLVDFNVKNLLSEGKTEPKYHAISRPAELEADAIDRAILLANSAGAVPYIVHVSSALGMTRIIEAKAKGLKVLSETCPQYLLLDDEKLSLPDFEGAKYVCSPPLRKKEDNDYLWQALSEGEFEIVSTDHCPFNFEGQKTIGRNAFNKIPNGLPGIEDRIPVLYSEGVKKGRLNLRQFVNLTSTNPAKVFGMFPTKGVIAPGADADIYILNPEKERTISSTTHHMNVDYNPYEGLKVNGKIEYVFLRGNLIVSEGKFLAEKGSGKYVKQNTGILDRSIL
ncbi:MAG: dihydropyrimidinase, partial [Ignavibacteria bacterium]